MVISTKQGLSQFFDSGEHKKVLVVDDSIASGSTMIEVKESLKHLKMKRRTKTHKSRQ
jgi:orotate phosphoribosyltransferase-like protein